MVSSVLRLIGAFLASIVTTFLLASFFHTETVLAQLAGIGAEIPLTAHLRTIIADMRGFALTVGMFPVIIAVTLLLGFSVAAILKRVITPLAPIAYPLAGASAIGVMLWIMSHNFDITPIAGARGAIGFSLQMLAGAVGGLVFTWLIRKPA